MFFSCCCIVLLALLQCSSHIVVTLLIILVSLPGSSCVVASLFSSCYLYSSRDATLFFSCCYLCSSHVVTFLFPHCCLCFFCTIASTLFTMLHRSSCVVASLVSHYRSSLCRRSSTNLILNIVLLVLLLLLFPWLVWYFPSPPCHL